MSGLRGALVGALTLVALQAIVSTSDAAGRTSGLFAKLAELVNKLVDPTQPFFEDHSGGEHKPSTAPASTATAAAPPPAVTYTDLHTPPPARTPAPAPTVTYV